MLSLSCLLPVRSLKCGASPEAHGGCQGCESGSGPQVPSAASQRKQDTALLPEALPTLPSLSFPPHRLTSVLYRTRLLVLWAKHLLQLFPLGSCISSFSEDSSYVALGLLE